MVNFNKPIIGNDEDDVHGTLREVIRNGEVTRALGWAINTGKLLLEETSEVRAYEKRIKGIAIGRTQLNWSLILFFADKVYNYN